MIGIIDITVKLVLLIILGGLVGLEREVRQKSAGLRTHVLVCMGSCLIMLTSMHIFDIYKNVATLDPARFAAGVITGIGFLGAGAIIRYGAAVRGLTTAAGLWITAAIGLAIGSGFFAAAIVSTILVMAVLLLLRYVEGGLWRRKN